MTMINRPSVRGTGGGDEDRLRPERIGAGQLDITMAMAASIHRSCPGVVPWLLRAEVALTGVNVSWSPA